MIKKCLAFMVCATLCLGALWGCAQNAGEDEEVFCRVLCLKEDGIVVEIPDLNVGYVYVRHTNTDLDIEPLDTVVMVFSKGDLEPVSGDFTDFFGEEKTHSHILENPKSIRFPDADAGEPTFG